LDINIERVDTQIFRDKKDDEVVVVEWDSTVQCLF
jgi:hypothetical protein